LTDTLESAWFQPLNLKCDFLVSKPCCSFKCNLRRYIPAHEYEILTCDWNKYNDCVIATGSVDKTVKLWDIRNPQR
jgi:WD40 repeat protein